MTENPGFDPAAGPVPPGAPAEPTGDEHKTQVIPPLASLGIDPNQAGHVDPTQIAPAGPAAPEATRLTPTTDYPVAAPGGYPPPGAPGYPASTAPTGAYDQGAPVPGGLQLPPPPDHPGQPEDAQAAPKRGKGKIVLAVVAAVLAIAAAAVAITGFWKPGFFWVKQLDVTAAQTGVEQVLTASTADGGYDVKNVTDVVCNDGKNPKFKDQRFTCTAKVNGSERTIDVTFLDNSGKFGVGAPK